MATARNNLLAGQAPYKRDFDKQIRNPTTEYHVGDQVHVNRVSALSSEERRDKDRVNNRTALRTEGPFLVLKVEGHTVTVLRGTGLKDRISRDRVVKYPPQRSAVKDATPSLADSRNDAETPST